MILIGIKFVLSKLLLAFIDEFNFFGLLMKLGYLEAVFARFLVVLKTLEL